MKTPARLYRGYVFDLDGTVYLGDQLLPQAREAILTLKRHARVVYLTNKPLELPADYAGKLTRMGIETSTGEVISSIDALVCYLASHAPAARLYVIGEPPLVEALRRAGHAIVSAAEDVEVVVVSFDRTFHYGKLQIAFDAVRNGARIVGTNPDAYCPIPGGGLPDCAAILAAVEACTGARAEAVVGKPSRHMAAVLLSRLGVEPHDIVLTGDRLGTDVRMANEANMHSALVLTGATRLEELPASPDQPEYVLRGLSDLVPSCAR